MKKIDRSNIKRRMSSSRKIRRRLRGILRVPKKWSRPRRVILLDSSMSSVKLSLRSRSRRKITKWLSMKEISWEHSSSREMKSYPFFTRKSRSKRVPWIKEKFITGRERMILCSLESTSLSWKDNWLFHKMRHPVFQTWRERFIFCKKNILNNNRKPNIFLMSLKSHSMSIDGESLNALTQKHTKWFKRFNLCRRDWSPRQRKYPRRMSLSRRKRSFTSNWRISLPSNQDPKLLRSFKSTSRTSKRELTNSRKWWMSWRTTSLKWMPTNSRTKDLTSKLAQSRSSTSTPSSHRPSKKRWKEKILRWTRWVATMMEAWVKPLHNLEWETWW